MRRIFLALLICLLPLQSFAGAVMGAAQAPCHEAYQPMQAESIDCCGSQAMCKTACPTAALLSSVISIVGLPKQANSPAVFVALFQSAEASAGFKPPIA